MIENDEQLSQANGAIARLEGALAALRTRVGPANPEMFAAMAEDYAHSIYDIRADIDAYLGLSAAADASVPLWMVLEGGRVSGRDISSRLLSEWLGNFRKAIYGVASFLETGQLRLGGRPEAWLLNATDPHVLAVAPGSIRIGLRLPSQLVQADLFDEADARAEASSHRALDYLLEVAGWASSGQINPPLDRGMDTDMLSVVARFASNLAPSPRSTVRSVTFTGASVPFAEPLRLMAESRERLTGLVKLLAHVTEETVSGQIREIDLDAHRIILRERGEGMPDLKGQVPAELMDKTERLLHKNVVVKGLISSAAPDTISISDISEASAL
jgi:hypothetical protein